MRPVQRILMLAGLLAVTATLSACGLDERITGTKAKPKPCPASFPDPTTDWWVITNDSGQVLAVWGMSIQLESGWEQRCKDAMKRAKK